MVAFGAVSMRSRNGSRMRLTGSRSSGDSSPCRPPRTLWRTLWSRLGRPVVERLAGRLDVFHFSDWMYPRQRSGLRSTIIHDLVPLHFPEWVHPRTRRQNLAKYRHAAETCDVIVTISEFTADDVSERLGFPRERIVVAVPRRGRALHASEPKEQSGTPARAAMMSQRKIKYPATGPKIVELPAMSRIGGKRTP